MQKLYFSKIREVKSPERGTAAAAGVDIFVPKFNEQFIADVIAKNPNISSILPGCYSYLILDNKIIIGAGERILLPSGIKIRGHKSIALNAHNKSGIGSKKGLDRLAEVVDEDYMGEIHISLVNTGNHMVEICENEKLIQFLEVQIENSELVELHIEELFLEETERGVGAFGSTNKN